MLKKIIIANWKMNPENVKEVEKKTTEFSKLLKNIKNKKDIDVVIAPPSIYLDFINKLKKKKRMQFVLGAQDADADQPVANTGGVSASMVSNFGVSYCIVGHSERRAKGENDETIRNKIISLFKNDITPILCVGEKDRDHKGLYLKEIEMQIRNALFGISKSLIKRIVVAYEPVWAIGVDAVRDATPEEAHEIYILIKKTIADIIGSKEANAIRIIFGGSVNEENAYTYIKESHMNGLLIGRASLDQKKFIKIIENISYVG